MKKIYILIIVAVLAVGGVAGVVLTVGNVTGPKYDQSAPEATVKSFIQAMLEGDTEAFGQLTKDVIPWSVMVSDLVNCSSKYMRSTSLSQYRYYLKETENLETTIVVYINGQATDSEDFFCFELSTWGEKNNKPVWYIVDVELPGYWKPSWRIPWSSICDEALSDGGKKFP